MHRLHLVRESWVGTERWSLGHTRRGREARWSAGKAAIGWRCMRRWSAAEGTRQGTCSILRGSIALLGWITRRWERWLRRWGVLRLILGAWGARIWRIVRLLVC